MKVELDDYQTKVIERVEKLMGTDYERRGNYIPMDAFISIIEDLEYQIHVLEEKVEDTESYYQDNLLAPQLRTRDHRIAQLYARGRQAPQSAANLPHRRNRRRVLLYDGSRR